MNKQRNSEAGGILLLQNNRDLNPTRSLDQSGDVLPLNLPTNKMQLCDLTLNSNRDLEKAMATHSSTLA